MTHSNACPATLRHVPGDWLISWQWWLDGYYLSGHPTREAAIRAQVVRMDYGAPA